ncbi:MAG: carboxylating nicotinate-nucleotide diphosphorylase [Candidatus Nanopelagicales bacterium]|nr:carboxylating nicotinate-nucleotide diphosphorylase [Candidatus Nanopelagicales bacterium]
MNDDRIDALIDVALAEDLADGPDVTSVATIPAGHRSRLDFVAREPGVVCGLDVASRVFQKVGPVEVEVRASDGDRIVTGEVLLSAVGATRDLLTAERTSLNLLTHLSGVATATARWVDVLGPDGPRVRDTRKTLPGLRALQKYAVRCGGGVNHRMSLSDAALVKDNHVVAAGGVREAFEAVRRKFPGLPVEVEVDSLEQLREVLAAGADLVLLDNFTPAQMREAVAITDGRARLEASGGLTLDNAAEVATTGVDFVAVGALTHSVQVLDIGADLQEVTDAVDD